MYKIEGITSYANQKKTLNFPDGTVANLSLYFVTNQKGWFIKELEYEGFVVRGLRVSLIPNLLRQFKNLIPFGLSVVGDREPMFLEDFETGVCRMYVLTKEEVDRYEDYLRE